MVSIPDSWRLADKALRVAQEAADTAAAYAASGDGRMAALYLHSARRSAEKAVEHLAGAHAVVCSEVEE